MGADYTAHAIIGIALPSQESLPKLNKKVRKRAFKHSFEDDGETKFDPKTGKPLWLDEFEEVESDDPVVVYDTDDEPSELEKGQKILKAPKGMEFRYGTDNGELFLGVVVSTGSSNGGEETEFLPMPDVNKIRDDLKACLEPLGLWDPSVFGLYANLYCSY